MTPRPADSTKNSTETDGALEAGNAPETLGAAAAGGSGLGPVAAPGAGMSALLAEHCARLGAEGGAVITVDADGLIGIPAVWPRPKGDDEPPDWLTAALRAAPAAVDVEDGAATTLPLHEAGALYGAPAGRHVVLVPLPPAVAGSEASTTGSEASTAGVAAPGAGSIMKTGDRHRQTAAEPVPVFTRARQCGVLAMALAGDEPGKLAEKVVAMAVRIPAGQLYALHLAAEEGQSESRRAGGAQAGAVLAPALALTSAVNDHDHFLAAAMAFCNELAARFACERVSLGLLHGRYVQLAAMSHTEKFSRKMQMIQLIEAVMEECLDQDIEVLVPPPASAEFVCRGARELSDRGTPRLAVLSLPLRRDGKVLGAVCVERAGDLPFAPAQVETLRLACDLCTVRLLDLRRADRWIGAKAASSVRAGLAAIVGPRHTWAKLAAVLLIAAGIYVGVASGDYRVDAPFAFQAATKQIVPAPFDGEVDSVEAKLGDKVRAGAVLATLKTLPLQRKLDQARAGLFEHLKQADAARSDKKWADAQMAAAQARQFQEQILLLTEQIEQATVKARIDGAVIRGGLDRFVGSSVEKGQVLFEIAPLDDLRAEILIPEDQVADLQAAMRAGEVRAVLAAGAYPDRPIEAVMERVLPLAEKIDGKVVFRARALLTTSATPGMEGREWIRPGMEGAAHVSLGQRRLAWIWSRRVVNKLRIWLWM